MSKFIGTLFEVYIHFCRMDINPRGGRSKPAESTLKNTAPYEFDRIIKAVFKYGTTNLETLQTLLELERPGDTNVAAYIRRFGMALELVKETEDAEG